MSDLVEWYFLSGLSIRKITIRQETAGDHDNPDFLGKPTYAVTELLRVHARHLIAAALEAEVTQVLSSKMHISLISDTESCDFG